MSSEFFLVDMKEQLEADNRGGWVVMLLPIKL
jgi:hypothetical protein